MSRNPGDPEKGRDRAAGIALASAALVVAGADYFPLWAKYGAVFGLSLLSAAFLRKDPWLLKLVRRGTLRLFSFLVHPDQEGMAERYPYYPGIVREHCRLLDITIRKLAKKARIPFLALLFFVTFPHFFPRTDYLRRLCEALLLPLSFLKHGGSYGHKYSRKRLLWYDENHPNFAKLITWARIRSASQEELDEMVSTVEDLRREELRRKKKGKVP